MPAVIDLKKQAIDKRRQLLKETGALVLKEVLSEDQALTVHKRLRHFDIMIREVTARIQSLEQSCQEDLQYEEALMESWERAKDERLALKENLSQSAVEGDSMIGRQLRQQESGATTTEKQLAQQLERLEKQMSFKQDHLKKLMLSLERIEAQRDELFIQLAKNELAKRKPDPKLAAQKGKLKLMQLELAELPSCRSPSWEIPETRRSWRWFFLPGLVLMSLAVFYVFRGQFNTFPLSFDGLITQRMVQQQSALLASKGGLHTPQDRDHLSRHLSKFPGLFSKLPLQDPAQVNWFFVEERSPGSLMAVALSLRDRLVLSDGYWGSNGWKPKANRFRVKGYQKGEWHLLFFNPFDLILAHHTWIDSLNLQEPVAEQRTAFIQNHGHPLPSELGIFSGFCSFRADLGQDGAKLSFFGADEGVNFKFRETLLSLIQEQKEPVFSLEPHAISLEWEKIPMDFPPLDAPIEGIAAFANEHFHRLLTQGFATTGPSSALTDETSTASTPGNEVRGARMGLVVHPEMAMVFRNLKGNQSPLTVIPGTRAGSFLELWQDQGLAHQLLPGGWQQKPLPFPETLSLKQPLPERQVLFSPEEPRLVVALSGKLHFFRRDTWGSLAFPQPKDHPEALLWDTSGNGLFVLCRSTKTEAALYHYLWHPSGMKLTYILPLSAPNDRRLFLFQRQFQEALWILVAREGDSWRGLSLEKGGIRRELTFDSESLMQLSWQWATPLREQTGAAFWHWPEVTFMSDSGDFMSPRTQTIDVSLHLSQEPVLRTDLQRGRFYLDPFHQRLIPFDGPLWVSFEDQRTVILQGQGFPSPDAPFRGCLDSSGYFWYAFNPGKP